MIPRRLLYLVTEDWYFLSHRLPMALAAQKAGYEVHVLTRVGNGAAAIRSHGFTLHPLSWKRGSLNPFSVLSIVREIRALYRTLGPDLVHHVAVQPTIIGSLAAVGLPFVRLNAFAGLGFGFTSRAPKARLIGAVLRRLLRILLRNPRAAVLVQNPDDRTAVLALGVPASRIFLVPGSGVEIDRLIPISEPDGQMTVAYVGRLLADKGLRTLIAAHKLLAERGQGVRLLIVGETDNANPASIPSAEIEGWKKVRGVELRGHVADIRAVWAEAQIAVLPSQREGLPKSLLEAAACGRPIIATDVPGCREVARENVNAILVTPDDPSALADAIVRLAHDAELRRRFGVESRRLIEREFSAERVGRDTVALYDNLLGHASALLPNVSSDG